MLSMKDFENMSTFKAVECDASFTSLIPVSCAHAAAWPRMYTLYCGHWAGQGGACGHIKAFGLALFSDIKETFGIHWKEVPMYPTSRGECSSFHTYIRMQFISQCALVCFVTYTVHMTVRTLQAGMLIMCEVCHRVATFVATPDS